MFKLGIISDSHGAHFRTELFARVAVNEYMDAVIHCGDGTGDAAWLRSRLSCPVYGVAGNCDPGTATAEELVCTFEGMRFLVLHGHRYAGIRYDLSAISYRAEELHADVVLYGHTHRPDVTRIHNVMLINPGALKDGRYGVLTIESGNAIPWLKELN